MSAVVVGSSCPKAPGKPVKDDGAPVPMQCKRMELLGFLWHGRYFFCVHQVSVELWKLHDTPRVSVQKKIIDLGIRLLNCTREQIVWLRKAGIIQNFRATMISMADTERLYDALEQSRRKRGLQKHALKTRSLPGQRYMRAEEQRARKLKCHPFSDSVSPCGEQGALIGALPDDEFVGLPAPCALLVAGSAETVPGMYNQWEHFIEHRIGFDAEYQGGAVGLPGGSRGNTSVIRTPVTNVGLKSRQCEQSNSVLSDSDCSDVFIVSDSEKDAMDRQVTQPQPAVPTNAIQPREVPAALPLKRTAAFRKGLVTKLCHFAQQGSPRWRAEQRQLEQKRAQAGEDTSSLRISIPLSKIKASPKGIKLSAVHRMMDKPRQTALCSFATMKRAVNCWPASSPSSTSSCSSDSSQVSEVLPSVTSCVGGGASSGAEVRVQQETCPSATPKGHDCSKNTKLQESDIAAPTAGGDMCEEEEVMVATSCLSPSGGVAWRRKSTRGKGRLPRAGGSVPVKSTFSFEDVFGYYPPKLVVRNGQLEPAYSLSVKNSDHSVLPEAHPILNWTLGRPVRGLCAPKKARKGAACTQ